MIEFYGIVCVFASGLVLGLARLKTDSLYLTIILHSTGNLISTIETAILVRMIN